MVIVACNDFNEGIRTHGHIGTKYSTNHDKFPNPNVPPGVLGKCVCSN